jgi:Rieske Fe-S protein
MTAPSPSCLSCSSRRTVLVAALGGVAAVLAGCASYGEPAAPPVGSGAGSTPPPPAPGAGAPAAARLAALADVPVGGGIVIADRNVVLTRPTDDTVLAFSATCTHAGCTVDEVSDGLIRCPCHGSVFDMTSGAPTAGPARRPLPAVAVAVQGSDVVVA